MAATSNYFASNQKIFADMNPNPFNHDVIGPIIVPSYNVKPSPAPGEIL
jgi:hypothetical protein